MPTKTKQNTSKLLTFNPDGSVTLRGKLASKVQRDARQLGCSAECMVEVALTKALAVSAGRLLPKREREGLEHAAGMLEAAAFNAGADSILRKMQRG